MVGEVRRVSRGNRWADRNKGILEFNKEWRMLFDICYDPAM